MSYCPWDCKELDTTELLSRQVFKWNNSDWFKNTVEIFFIIESHELEMCIWESQFLLCVSVKAFTIFWKLAYKNMFCVTKSAMLVHRTIDACDHILYARVPLTQC